MPSDESRHRAVEHTRVVLGETVHVHDEYRVGYIDRVAKSFFEQVESDRGLDPETHPVYERFKRKQDVIAIKDGMDLPDGITLLATEADDDE